MRICEVTPGNIQYLERYIAVIVLLLLLFLPLLITIMTKT
jgi:hypothetical protein